MVQHLWCQNETVLGSVTISNVIFNWLARISALANTYTSRMQPVQHLNKINSHTCERIHWLLLTVNGRHVNELIHAQVLSLPVVDNKITLS